MKLLVSLSLFAVVAFALPNPQEHVEADAMAMAAADANADGAEADAMAMAAADAGADMSCVDFNAPPLEGQVRDDVNFKGANSPKGGPNFAIFDTLPSGDQFTTGPCTEDAECQSACCDGTICRAPDALTPGVQTCRNGLTPNFATGIAEFECAAVSEPPAAADAEADAGAEADANAMAAADANADGAEADAMAMAAADANADGAEADAMAMAAADANADGADANAMAMAGADAGADMSCVDFNAPPLEDQVRDDVNFKGAKSPNGGPNFAIFDTLPSGEQFTKGSCTEDAECQSACCDGMVCRAPDALTPGVETCRNGLTPNFATGIAEFECAAVSEPPAAAA